MSWNDRLVAVLRVPDGQEILRLSSYPGMTQGYGSESVLETVPWDCRAHIGNDEGTDQNGMPKGQERVLSILNKS